MELNDLLIETSAPWIDAAITLLRLFIGPCFIVHALGKLGLVGLGNMQGFVAWLTSLGVPYPAVQARLAMLSELIGGSLLTQGNRIKITLVDR